MIIICLTAARWTPLCLSFAVLFLVCFPDEDFYMSDVVKLLTDRNSNIINVSSPLTLSFTSCHPVIHSVCFGDQLPPDWSERGSQLHTVHTKRSELLKNVTVCLLSSTARCFNLVLYRQQEFMNAVSNGTWCLWTQLHGPATACHRGCIVRRPLVVRLGSNGASTALLHFTDNIGPNKMNKKASSQLSAQWRQCCQVQLQGSVCTHTKKVYRPMRRTYVIYCTIVFFHNIVMAPNRKIGATGVF